MTWWYDTLKGGFEQIYEFLNNEESIGEALSEFAYTVQTGYPRYILNNFSLEDLRRFLDHPHLDSFFIFVRMDRDGKLEYGLVYKKQFRESCEGEWFVSHVTGEKYVQSVSITEYITGKPHTRREGYFSEDEGDTGILVEAYEEEPESEEEEESKRVYPFEDERMVRPEVEEKVLLLRPKTGSFSNHKIRKLIARYETKGESAQPITSENYIFHLILGQPEYLDAHLFDILRDLFRSTLSHETHYPMDIAKICKRITALFDDTFRAYQVGLLL